MRMAEWREALRKAKTAKERTSAPRVKMPELAADYRVTCNEEVNQGLTIEMAMAEASRCLDCANPQCVTGCPVGIDIPGFIKNVERGEFAEAARVIKKTSALPAVCGRVCPQEKQCESRCIHTKMKHEAVAIGYLERFVADWARSHGSADEKNPAANGIKVAVVGSGPAGLAFAGDMAKRGYSVTVYEALHEIGGVLKYGIPEFRLPNAIVDTEIDGLRRLGYRMSWEDDFRAYLKGLDSKKPVVVCGDLNVAHREIDLKNPKTNRRNAGFTDEERGKMTELLDAGFTDTFRHFHPDTPDIYSWWSYRFHAREKNAGWRIDYFLTSARLDDKLQDAKIHTEIFGSDHCPVEVDIDL